MAAGGYDGEIKINTEIETKNVNSQMMKVANAISKTEREIETLKSKMQQLENTKIPTQQYLLLQKELQSAETKADSLYGKLRILENTNVDRTSLSFQKLKAQIEDTDDKIDVLRMELEDLESGGMAFTSGADSEEYKKAANRVLELTDNIDVSKKRMEELNDKAEKAAQKFNEIKNKAKNSFEQINKSSKKSSGLMKTFTSRLKGIALSLLVFNWITKAFNAMVNGMKEGFNNLVQYSDEYNDAMSNLKSSSTQLKNSFATAFAPIIQVAVPALITLIGYITEASNKISEFFAILQGKNTWTRAVKVQEDYAASLGKTGKNAKKAQGALASFDTIEVLSKKDSETGAAETAPADMFEQVAVDQAKVTMIMDLKNQIRELKEELFTGFEENPLVNAIKNIFSVFEGENAKAAGENFIGIFTSAFGGLSELLPKVGEDITNAITKPIIDNQEPIKTALDGTIKTTGSMLGTLRDTVDRSFSTFNTVYDEYISPFINSMGEGWSSITNTFLTFWNTHMQPYLDRFAEKFDELFKNHIQPLIDNFIIFIGEFAQTLQVFWENVLVPLINWIIENILPVILPIFEGVTNAFFVVLESVTEVVGGIIDSMRGILEFLQGVFTGDWDKAWSGVLNIFKGIKRSMAGVVNGILGVMESLANGVIEAINMIIRTMNNLSFDIPDWVPGIGGESFGFDIPEIRKINIKKIPALADGAVIRGGNPFLAMLGDQPSGQTNVETPVSTIEDAVARGMEMYGGAGGNLTVNLELDGETFARLFMPNWLQEASRRGLNVDILEGNA